MSLELTVDSRELQRAMLASPAILGKHLTRAIERVTLEMARDARRRAPKAFSTLTQSINSAMVSPVEGLVFAGADYARLVEEGTRGGSGRRPPPKANILDWIKVRRIQPDDPTMSQEDLAYVFARSIARKGTPAQPFMRPAYEANRVKAEQRISKAIDAALTEIGR
ncbi:MAG: HK97-gp10 family putative phage morphogenesis protein [Burkholderiaceae bacterium]